jgi:threonine dehydrogenase-like Zn-dependent dehydrogenase
MELARRLGATVFDAMDPNCERDILDATDGWGVTASIETSGVQESLARIGRLSSRRAQVGIVAWGLQVNLPPIVPLGLDIHGCWHWNHQMMGPRMIETIRQARPYLDQVVTHRFDLDDVSAAMDLQDSGECGKVHLYPHGLEQE